jgi:hypothetical protein
MPEDYPFSVEELNQELADELGPGEELQIEDFEEIKIEGLPERPSFPIMVFILAVLKDFTDLLSFGLLGVLTNIIAWIAIRMYLFRKVGFIKRWLYKRYVFTLILEFIPFISMIPQWTIFVLRGYAKEKKRVDEVLTAVERLLLKEAGAPEIFERFV